MGIKKLRNLLTILVSTLVVHLFWEKGFYHSFNLIMSYNYAGYRILKTISLIALYK